MTLRPSLVSSGDVEECGNLGSATFSPDYVYRYDLTRDWGGMLDGEESRVVWLCLNPSTATANQDDPTIRRCIGFSKSWGCTGLTILNLFAFRATDPKDMKAVEDAVGPHNDRAIAMWTTDPRTRFVVCAWGTHGVHQGRADKVRRLLSWLCADKTFHLGLAKEGQPRHPLYVAASTPLTSLPLDVEPQPCTQWFDASVEG